MKSSGLAPIDDEPVHVFGRNLEDRVIESKQEDDDHDKQEEKHEQEDDVETIKRRKFETITGEEDEETAFQGDFKLFIWDKSTSNWIEKGRGQLKLNDSVVCEEQKYRLIMRAGGTYRIILNVAIQHSFFKVIAVTKTSIRFTDSQNVWAASGSNAKHLGDLIAERLKVVAEQAKRTAEDNGAHTKDEQGDASIEEKNTEGRRAVSANAIDAKHDDKERGERETSKAKIEPDGKSIQDQGYATGNSIKVDTSKPENAVRSEADEPDDNKSEESADNKSDGSHLDRQSNSDVSDNDEIEEKQDQAEESNGDKQHNEGETKRIKLGSS